MGTRKERLDSVSEKRLKVKIGGDEADLGIVELGDLENKRKCQQRRIVVGRNIL